MAFLIAQVVVFPSYYTPKRRVCILEPGCNAFYGCALYRWVITISFCSVTCSDDDYLRSILIKLMVIIPSVNQGEQFYGFLIDS